MSPIDFIPTPPPSDPDRDRAKEVQRADENKQVEQAAAFKQAMLRRGPGEAGRPALPATPAQVKSAASTAEPAKPAAPPRGQPGAATAKSANPTSANTAPAASAGANNAAGLSRRSSDSLDSAAAASLLRSAPASDESDAPTFTGGSMAGSSVTGSADSEHAIPAAAGAGTGNSTRQQASRESATGEGGDGQQHASDAQASAAKGSGRRSIPAAERTADVVAPRIDLASIVPSFPLPQPAALVAPPLAAGPRQVNTAMIEQIVQFAAVGHNSAGQTELLMGLSIGSNSRVGVRLTACGKRRIRLCFSGLAESELVGESQINALVESLRGRDIEVTEMLIE